MTASLLFNMIRALMVFSAVLGGIILVEGRSVEDPSPPGELNLEGMLGRFTQSVFKEMRGAGYEVETEHDAKEDTELPESKEDKETNLLISKYLQYLESVKYNKKDLDVKNALNTMRLLVAYSWLFSMNPRKEVMQGTIPLPIDQSMTLDKTRSDIAADLKERNSWVPVSEAILLYTDGVFQSIKEELQSNNDAYESMITKEKLLMEIIDFNVREKFIKDNKQYKLLMDENRLLLEIHVGSMKMALQSYLRLFGGIDDGQYKFRLTSRDGKRSKQFNVPPMTADKLERMIFEAELEDVVTRYPVEEEKPELDRSHQNLIVSQYLKTVENIGKKYFTKSQDASALQIVKLLFLQSWIHMLRPDLKLVAKVYPVETSSTLDGIHKNVVMKLKKSVTHADVVDSIIRFANSLHKQIRLQLLIQARELCPWIDGNIKTIARLKNGPEKDNEITLKNENLVKLTNLESMSRLHGISTKMCLQSYVLDFLKEPYKNPVTLTSTTGEKFTMDLPPLGTDSYEELLNSS